MFIMKIVTQTKTKQVFIKSIYHLLINIRMVENLLMSIYIGLDFITIAYTCDGWWVYKLVSLMSKKKLV